MPVLDVVAVRSEKAAVLETPTGFSAVVSPPDNPAWSYAAATPDDFARIDIDVAVPPGGSGASGVIFDSWYCAVEEPRGACAGGNAMVRAFPLSR